MEKSWFFRGRGELSGGRMFRRCLCAAGVLAALSAPGAEADAPPQNVRKIRLIQDDAQDYMVSKIYSLKYTQANDLVPFVSGMVLRYNTNSSVNTIEYGNNQQYL
ncbi:MAG: hypothetical protein J6R86_07200, partial [Lentisphaeria bacterium]|nr:hypothetical protein [Lentisphaeria bacterium]